MKRSLDIEALLSWAYRDELAKMDFLGGGSFFWSGFAELGTKVTSSGNSLQAYASIIGDGVHPDAERIHKEVCSLGSFQPDWEEPEILLSDMPEEVQALAANAVKGYRVQLDVMVLRCAKLGTRPDWRADGVPVKKPVLAARSGQAAWFVMEEVEISSAGRVVGTERREVNGYDQQTKRPKPGAYRKYFYDPDPGMIVDRRADYACWHAGLVSICESLKGELDEHEPVPPKIAALPWEDHGSRKPRILAALRAKAA